MNSVGGYEAKISAFLKGHSLVNAIPKIPLRKLLMKNDFCYAFSYIQIFNHNTLQRNNTLNVFLVKINLQRR